MLKNGPFSRGGTLVHRGQSWSASSGPLFGLIRGKKAIDSGMAAGIAGP